MESHEVLHVVRNWRLQSLNTRPHPSRLCAGDYSNQFRMAGQRFGTSATVAGTIGLPDTTVTTRNVAAQDVPGDQTLSLP